ncbi:MAG: glycosyltransferase family 9 protein [Deltaproteobacteria bacterium]|jgi:hypothetical protein|nr:glycosyltransferase family 9 protein [Deltaproteobacteria bacterium]
MPEKPPDFLIVQLARIGDLIQTKRLLLSLEREGRVHLALDAGLAELAGLVFPRAVLHPIRAHAGGRNPAEVLAVNAGAFAGLAEMNFKAIYNLNRNPLALALAGMFPPESVVGYRLEQGQALSSTWCKMAGRWSGAGRRLSSPLNLTDFWAWFHPDPLAPTLVNPAARAKNVVETTPGKGGQRLGVVLAGREPRRSLPPEYLARVVEALFAARKGPEILLLGSRDEQAGARKLSKYLDGRVLQKVRDLSGKTSLPDFYEVVGSLDLMLTPDTGGMHLAAHLGVPVVAFFLSSALAWETGPYGLGHTVWQSVRRGCSPCLETEPCPYKTACLPPFAAPGWLTVLSGRAGAALPGGDPALLGLESCFDDIGVDYRVFLGEASALPQARRCQKRRLLREFLRRPGQPGKSGGPAGIDEAVINEVISEADWMLREY